MTKRRHQYTGETQASGLVTWLNSGQSDGRKRVEEIIQLYGRLGKSVPPVAKTGAGALSLRLWMLLDRYTYKLTNRGTVTGFMPAAMGPQDAPDWQDESGSVLALHRLRQMGLLSRVKRCPSCQKWLFAKLPGRGHRFCTVACRIKANQSDPKWRARNNAKRKRIYRLRKEKGYLLRTQERRGTL